MAGWKQEVNQFSCVISESFSLTGKPADPTVVIEGVNSTQVELVWNFTAAPSSSFLLSIRRRRPTESQSSQVASRNRISGVSSNFTVLDSDYEANFPATLVIKNVTRNSDEFVYSIAVSAFDGGELSDAVTVNVLCKYEQILVCSFMHNGFCM